MQHHSTLVRLWDGNDYERTELDRAWPGLAGYAAEHEEYVETILFEPATVRRQLLKYWCAAYVIVIVYAALIIAAGACPNVSFIEASIGALIGLTFCAAAGWALQATIGVAVLRKHFPIRVSVQDGIVRVVSPSREKEGRLADLQWYFGYAHEGEQLLMWYSRRRAIILLFPPARSWLHWGHYGRRAACGMTEETRLFWHAFLSVAGVREKRSSKKR